MPTSLFAPDFQAVLEQGGRDGGAFPSCGTCQPPAGSELRSPTRPSSRVTPHRDAALVSGS
jgi:hypothetical protein